MGEKRLSEAVLNAIASAEGVETSELSVPLHSAVDTDGLDRLFTAGVGHVVFQYYGYEVTVDAEAAVTLRKTAECE